MDRDPISVRFLPKQNAKILWALPEVLDISRDMIRHVDVRKLDCANGMRK